jgi:hypothetical protein
MMTFEQRVDLAKSIMYLLDEWGLSSQEKINLLAIPGSVRSRTVGQFYSGKALPDDPEVMNRVEHIVGIADALRTSYPRNGSMPAYWLNQNNKLFGDRTPLNCMLEDGLDGIVAVRVHLDCAYDWEISDTVVADSKSK